MVAKKLITICVLALLAIEIGSVAGSWKEVVARRPDFFDLYNASRLIRSGEQPAYNRGPNAAQSAEMSNQPSSVRTDALHPPFESLIFMPLSIMPDLNAYKTWLVCNLVMLWSVPFLLWQYLPRLHRDSHFGIILYGSFFPATLTLVQG